MYDDKDLDQIPEDNSTKTLEKITELRNIIQEQGLLQSIQKKIITKDEITGLCSHIFKDTNHYHLSVELDLTLFLKKRTETSPIDWRGSELLKNPHAENFLIKYTIYDTVIYYNRYSILKKEKTESLHTILSNINNIGIPIRYIIYSNKNKCICLCFEMYQSAFFAAFIYKINGTTKDNVNRDEFIKTDDDIYIQYSISDTEKVTKIMNISLDYNGFVFYTCECISTDIIVSSK